MSLSGLTRQSFLAEDHILSFFAKAKSDTFRRLDFNISLDYCEKNPSSEARFSLPLQPYPFPARRRGSAPKDPGLTTNSSHVKTLSVFACRICVIAGLDPAILGYAQATEKVLAVAEHLHKLPIFLSEKPTIE